MMEITVKKDEENGEERLGKSKGSKKEEENHQKLHLSASLNNDPRCILWKSGSYHDGKEQSLEVI